MVAILLSLVGCVEDVGEGKVAAKVEETPQAPPAPEPVPAAPGHTLTVAKEKSSIKALGAKITATHPIEFKEFSGSIDVAGTEVKGISFEVQMDSLTTDHPKLQAHLKDADFFDVTKWPTASFKSASVTAQPGEGGATHTVAGDLTLRDQTKRVTFPAIITTTGDAATAKTEFVLNRKDFGIVYAGKADDLIQDNVVLTVSFEAAMANAPAPAAGPGDAAGGPAAGHEGKAGKADH